VRIFRVNPLSNNHLRLNTILKILSKEKITSLLVEGGADIFNQFIEEDEFDEIIILQAPKILSKGIAIKNSEKIKELQQASKRKLGNDIILIYKK
jgi:riboflavin biosynthesis pyrimidine reductase